MKDKLWNAGFQGVRITQDVLQFSIPTIIFPIADQKEAHMIFKNVF